MPFRVLIFSLCLTGSLPAASIEPLPFDPWASLRTAPAPPATPDPPGYAVPNLTLELEQLLQFVLTWVYAGVEDPVEKDAILAALRPQYEAFLNGRQSGADPDLSPTSIAVESPVSAQPALGDPASVPEPRTWLLLAAGLAAVVTRPLYRRG